MIEQYVATFDDDDFSCRPAWRWGSQAAHIASAASRAWWADRSREAARAHYLSAAATEPSPGANPHIERVEALG